MLLLLLLLLLCVVAANAEVVLFITHSKTTGIIENADSFCANDVHRPPGDGTVYAVLTTDKETALTLGARRGFAQRRVVTNHHKIIAETWDEVFTKHDVLRKIHPHQCFWIGNDGNTCSGWKTQKGKGAYACPASSLFYKYFDPIPCDKDAKLLCVLVPNDEVL